MVNGQSPVLSHRKRNFGSWKCEDPRGGWAVSSPTTPPWSTRSSPVGVELGSGLEAGPGPGPCPAGGLRPQRRRIASSGPILPLGRTRVAFPGPQLPPAVQPLALPPPSLGPSLAGPRNGGDTEGSDDWAAPRRVPESRESALHGECLRGAGRRGLGLPLCATAPAPRALWAPGAWSWEPAALSHKAPVP